MDSEDMNIPSQNRFSTQDAQYETFQQVLDHLPQFCRSAETLRDILLANTVMLGEIPAPTFHEQARIDFLCRRFAEIGLEKASVDEIGNGFAILPGTEVDKNIILVAHADTNYPKDLDHTITITKDKIIGRGVADNSIGLAVLTTLPDLLEELKIQLRSNLILMGDVRSLGHGNLEGLRYFLDTTDLPLQAGICIEGVNIGRLSYGSMGMLRGEIVCALPDEYDWKRYGTTNAIVTLAEIINKITAIPISLNTRTRVIMGSIKGGTSFNKIPTSCTLQFELRSESDETVDELSQKLDDIITEVSAHTKADIKFKTLSRVNTGGLAVHHPLVRCTNAILKDLGLTPTITPSISELSSFIARDIPAITLGITEGDHYQEKSEYSVTSTASKGMAQLLALILSLDRELCNADHGMD